MTVGESGVCPSVVLEVLREMPAPQHEECVHFSECVFMFREVDGVI